MGSKLDAPVHREQQFLLEYMIDKLLSSLGRWHTNESSRQNARMWVKMPELLEEVEVWAKE